MFHETIWFLRGDTNIKYLEDNNCPIWRPDAFQANLPGMQKEGIFPEARKYSADWDKTVKEYGRVKEDPPKDGEMQVYFWEAGGDGNILIMRRGCLLRLTRWGK